ncbi:MAG: hypothetical protein RJB31_1034, partial [Bacteroidota bacterium]
ITGQKKELAIQIKEAVDAALEQ